MLIPESIERGWNRRILKRFDRRRRKCPPNQTEKTMIRVTPKAVAYIAERGGNLTLYSKILAN